MNEAGGTFEAKRTSTFGGGADGFINMNGGTVHAANASGQEIRFVNLERFTNRGLISTLDNSSNDVFRISNTPGGKNLTFTGSGNSTLAVDAFLRGPGSRADNLIVNGSTTGRTKVVVVNTNTSSARFDPVPVPLVFVRGKNVNKNNFYLSEPVDAGFFDYDLFFKPTGSSIFELKNHVGGGGHLLPELVTLTHDAFHNATETWFDQSTDLRVMLARGASCSDPARPQSDMRCQQLYRFTPGVWARGSGTWLDLKDSGVTNAHGRTYHYDLGRDFNIGLFESGIDFGKRDLFAQGDILVLGVLGGAVEATLDYKTINRTFNLEGGEAGAYATYLNGRFFVDTLFKSFSARSTPRRSPASPTRWTIRPTACAPIPAIDSAACGMACSSSRSPRLPPRGVRWRTSRWAATWWTSATTRTCVGAWACGSAPAAIFGMARRSSPS
jgi:autotransporter family porin